MTDVTLSARFGDVPAYVAEPEGEGPWPGVVVIHDANGMSTDLRKQADWLAADGFLAIAPDLYRGGAKVRCMFRTMFDLMRGHTDRVFDAIDAAHGWLMGDDRGTGRIGVIGFCMGGGLALMVAPRGRFQAASVNYGAPTKDVIASIGDSCPIVASFGGRDPTLRNQAAKLGALLDERGVPHDIAEYPAAGHGFMNDHPAAELPMLLTLMARVSRTGFDATATADARRRIVAFFRQHLTD